MPKARIAFTPDPQQMALWPAVSGNTINGLGEAQPRRPSPIYWHAPDVTPHGPLQRWFYERTKAEPLLVKVRAERQRAIDEPLAAIAPDRAELSAQRWTDLVKKAAMDAGADLVGITRMRDEWVFQGYEVPQRWIVMLGVAHDYEQMKLAPRPEAAAEVVRQYGRGNQVAKRVASAIRLRGHEAVPHGGPVAGPMLLIPPALECGFGELGKHGSLIHRQLGSNFRLASVATDVPLLANAADSFGADHFCLNCRLCANECPTSAISNQKAPVRGTHKWYVDFDKCLPFFNETAGCGICIAVCPWSRPGVAARLASRASRRSGTGVGLAGPGA